MVGSEKQIVWATEVLAPVRTRIAQFPTALRIRHERSLERITSASRVIQSRAAINGWCERVDQWLSGERFQTAVECNPAGYAEPSLVSSVIC